MAARINIRGLKQREAESVYLGRLSRYLRKIGWTRSAVERRAVDAEGNKLPWFTYPAIRFLEPRISRDFKVFEYGSGYSTFWWAERAERVVACEHDRAWFDLLKGDLPQNVEYIHRALEYGGEYCKEVTRHRSTDFDIIAIDGRDRVNCMLHSLSVLSSGTVLVIDNSTRERYTTGFEALLQAGFKRLDFHGLGPINTAAWCTSVVYRDGNCLGI